MERRTFVKSTTFGAGALALSGIDTFANVLSPAPVQGVKMANLKNPLAIAMWDFSWLLRHHRFGEFENWDLILDGLVQRGYNAIRLDVFPQLVAADNQGNVQEKFLAQRDKLTPMLWGNQWSCYIEPRKALLEFLPKCKERGIYVGLSTWFMSHGINRNEQFEGLEGFVRAWNETLTFLDSKKLLDNVIYVDLLNEYPLWHGYSWLKKAVNKMEPSYKEPTGNDANANMQFSELRSYNDKQKKFFNDFISSAISKLKMQWPGLSFFASTTYADDIVKWQEMDLKKFDVIDSHVWLVHNPDLHKKIDWVKELGTENDANYEKCYKNIITYWKENRKSVIDWMENQIKTTAEIGKKLNVPYGNTEGWGIINQYDHPMLDWEFTKEAGIICAELGRKYGYKFNCSSNFTHPQFKGIWDDIAWHKKVTDIIKN